MRLLLMPFMLFLAFRGVDTEKGATAGDTVAEPDTIIYDTLTIPDGRLDSAYPYRILTTGDFHDEEIWPGAKDEKWYGLFKTPDGHFLSKTKIKVARVNDPIADEEAWQQTGWRITTPGSDGNVLLVAGITLPERKVKAVSLPKQEIFPGDTIKFPYLGMDYMLFATGGKRRVVEAPTEWYEAWNYRLYLSAVVKGKTVTELLVSQPGFDEAMISIIFAGDIDGDGKLDMILNTTRHYNMSRPTLYLSKPAGKGHLLMIAGLHVSLGC